METTNVVYFYKWDKAQGEIGQPVNMPNLDILTMKELIWFWPDVAKVHNIDLSCHKLIHIDITVGGIEQC